MRNYIIVTGVFGYIGRHIATAVIAQGYNLIGIDLNDAGMLKFLHRMKEIYNSPSEIEFVGCNLESRSNTLKCVKTIQDMKCRILAICHCAGSFDKIDFHAGYDDLRCLFTKNIICLENALLIASKTRPDKFIFPNSFCSLDTENWSYFGLAQKLCKTRMCEESLFNSDTKFVNIYFGVMYGNLPFVPVKRGSTLANEIDRVKNLTIRNLPVLHGYSNKAMRDWIYPVSPFDVIGAFMYAITFDNGNDVDLAVGVLNEDRRLEPFNLFRFIDTMLEGYPVQDCLFMIRNVNMPEKVSDLIQKHFEKPSFNYTVYENLSDLYLSCIPPKLLTMPENLQSDKNTVSVKASTEMTERVTKFYDEAENLLENRNSKAGMIKLLKTINDLSWDD